MRKHTKIMSLTVIFSAGTLFACSSADTETSEEAPSEDTDASAELSDPHDSAAQLNVALQGIPPTIDPHITNSTMTTDIARPVYETLVALDENFEPQPMLADSWEVNDDQTEFIFHLREGVLFHNGEEMVAEDVVASLERWVQQSATALANLGEGVEFHAESDYTVVMEVEQAAFLSLETLGSPMRFAAIMPQEIVEGAGSTQVTEVIGTGPFAVEEYVFDQYVTYSRFDDYEPRPEEPSGLAGKKQALVADLQIEFIEDDSTRLASLTTEQHDIARGLSYDNYDQVEEEEHLNSHLHEAGAEFIIFNKARGVFENQSARQAVQAGLDMEALSIGTYSDDRFYELNPSYNLEEQINWYTEAGAEFYNQNDTDRAEELLDEAGYDGEEITILTSTISSHTNMSIALQDQLNNLGINADLETYEFSTVLEYREDPENWDIFVVDSPTESNPTQYNFFDSRNNFAGWTDSEEIDNLLDHIRTAPDYETASEYTDELQEEVYNYVPVIKPSNRYNVSGSSVNIDNYQDFANGMILWNVTKQ